MRYLFLIWVLCLSFSSVTAQYNGSHGDGTDKGTTIQLSLDGIPGGIRPLYAGGNGDGIAYTTGFASLAGGSFSSLFLGGHGDGFDHQVSNFSLNGLDLSGIFQGGIGDGFDHQSQSLSLDGFELSQLYNGGDGDGFDNITFAASLDGQLLTGIYSGGTGDGFDRSAASSPLGLTFGMLFNGGNGDGFDKTMLGSSLGGIDISAIYGGGAGDGTDHTRYEGLIPLPLTLISFTATAEEKYVLLRWVTEDERDTDFFTIEKTKEGRSFNWVGEQLAAGSSLPEEQIHYETKDWQPYEGQSYYRLKTTDFDGQVAISHLVAVQYQLDQKWDFQLFPNPNTGQHFNINTEGLPDNTPLQLEVLDANGRQIFNKEILSNTYNSERVNLSKRLSTGSYLIRLVHPKYGQQAKILLVGGR